MADDSPWSGCRRRWCSISSLETPRMLWRRSQCCRGAKYPVTIFFFPEAELEFQHYVWTIQSISATTNRSGSETYGAEDPGQEELVRRALRRRRRGCRREVQRAVANRPGCGGARLPRLHQRSALQLYTLISTLPLFSSFFISNLTQLFLFVCLSVCLSLSMIDR